tara:strand:- start:723 stop:923 length:201 start_codon:yes stop_codon:yes gene_type:complete
MNYNETIINNDNSTNYLFRIFISGISFIGLVSGSMIKEYIEIILEDKIDKDKMEKNKIDQDKDKIE